MAKSTQVITDLTGVTTTAFGATAQAAAVNPANRMASLEGLSNLALLKAQELLTICNQLVLDQNGTTTNALVKAGDPNFTAIDSVRQVLV